MIKYNNIITVLITVSVNQKKTEGEEGALYGYDCYFPVCLFMFFCIYCIVYCFCDRRCAL